MRVAIVGSRHFIDYEFFKEYIPEFVSKEASLIVSGGATGVDTLAEVYAREHNIKTQIFLPDYKTYPPKIAPIKRNTTIVENCDILIAFWNHKTPGTRNSIEQANKKRIPVHIITIN